MKKIFTLFGWLFLGLLFVGNSQSDEMERVAKNAFYEKALLAGKKVKYEELKLETTPHLFLIEKGEKEYKVAFRIWKVKGQGFIITSAVKNVKPVLAYSFENSYSNNIPPNTIYMLNYYKKVISYAYKNNVKASEEVKKQWDWYENATPEQIEKAVVHKGVKSVDPLLLTTWGQGKYYNASCPEDDAGIDGHVAVGCVALSTSMVMKYYNYPDVGQGSKTSYNSTNGGYGTFTIDFSQHEYHFENMPLDASRYNSYLSDLLFHVGVAVNMYWGPDGSGTYTEFIPGALRDYFRYSSDVTMVQRSDYSTADWIALLQNQLDNKWPMVYSGQSDQGGGHAWNCDGYQDTYFHMNWGWDGAYNGFYDLDDLVAGGYDFTSDFKAVINIYPPASEYPVGCQAHTIEGFEGSFEDGSGNQPYGNGWHCTYLLQPSCGKYITLKFAQFDLVSGDEVIIHDGASASDPVIATLTSSNAPSTADLFRNTDPDGMLLEFITDNTGAGEGWMATYSVKNCSTDTLTESSGAFDDGSGWCDYSEGTYCKWYINTNNDALLLTFDEWNLPPSETGDYLQIYNGLGTSELITKLTGDSTPTTLLIPSGQATLRFMSDADDVVAGGWRITYSPAEFVDLQDVVGVSIAVFPNPISENSYIEINPTHPMTDLMLELFDNLGRKIGNYYLGDIAGKTDIEFSKLLQDQLANGVYVLKVSNKQFAQQIKIISY